MMDPRLGRPQDGRTVIAASEVLAAWNAVLAAWYAVLATWYAAHPSVRRLWAIRESQRIRVMVTLEPTPDSDDMYPGWLANGRDWAHELQASMDVPVILEVLHDSIVEAVATDADSVLVAELLWRDSSLPRD